MSILSQEDNRGLEITVAVPREVAHGEQRVAMVPDMAARLRKTGYEVLVETGAGKGAYFSDSAYKSAGVRVCRKGTLYSNAQIILKVQAPPDDEFEFLRESSILICFLNPFKNTSLIKSLCQKGVTSFSVELIPRITRAQSMDALSSQSTVAGYKAALIAADRLGRFLPMLTTAAGTVRPARVLVLGAGVAGLQAIATSHRLGAIVEAYDVRRTVKEQVESLGARFVGVEIDAEGEGGYARELTEGEKEKEKELLNLHITEADIVITTALIPGRPAPLLITADLVSAMKSGSVIVDLAGEWGGNCELTQPGKEIKKDGVIICGPLNLPSMIPFHASEMYSRNLYNFLNLLTDGCTRIEPDLDDEIIKGSLVTYKGKIINENIRLAVEGEKT